MERISVDLPDEVAEALTRAALSLGSTPDALLLEATRDFLAEQLAYDAALAESEAEMAAGREVPHEEVMAEMRSWAADLRARNAER